MMPLPSATATASSLSEQCSCRLNTRYAFLCQLADHNGTVVSRLFDRQRNRNVVTKLCRPHAHRLTIAALYREALLGHHLRHDNLVHLEDAMRPLPAMGRSLPMALVLSDAGQTLKAYLRLCRSARANPVEVSRHFGQQLFTGLHYLHGIGVIHGDLKPANVCIDAGLRLRLVDFGAARLSAHPFDLHLIGTAYYRAPELIYELFVSPAADLWSAGCVLLDMANLGSTLAGISWIGELEHVSRWVDDCSGGGALLAQLSDDEVVSLSCCFARIGQCREIPRLADVVKDESLLGLVKGLMQLAAGDRLDAGDALRHPFFGQAAVPDASAYKPLPEDMSEALMSSPNSQPREVWCAKLLSYLQCVESEHSSSEERWSDKDHDHGPNVSFT